MTNEWIAEGSTALICGLTAIIGVVFKYLIRQPTYAMPPFIAIGLSWCLDQRIASLTRKSQPSIASNYQTGFHSQGIKRPAHMPPAF